MTCDHCVELLSDLIDGTLAPADAAAVHEHCRGCASCRSVMEDLLDITHVAASLDRHEPSPLLRDVIKAQTRSIAAVRTTRRRFASARTIFALAASLVAIVAISMMVITRGRQGSDGGANASLELANATSELQLAEEHYSNAIVALEKVTADKQAKLDPQVAEAITQSLASIDKAIGDSRAALKTQPDSIVAQTSLLEALRMKVALLQETVSLMNLRS
jgi:predicted anti-sigma-YlaC factor YlaD